MEECFGITNIGCLINYDSYLAGSDLSPQDLLKEQNFPKNEKQRIIQSGLENMLSGLGDMVSTARVIPPMPFRINLS
jgi:hypothetical protein